MPISEIVNLGGNGEGFPLVGRPLFGCLFIHYFHLHRVEGNIHCYQGLHRFHPIPYPLGSWGAAPHSFCGQHGRENKA